MRFHHPPTLRNRFLIIAGVFLLAFVIHSLFGGRWTTIVFSAAVATAVLTLVPSLSRLVKPVGSYLGLWLGFNLLRAYADDTGWADAVVGVVPKLEAWLAGGTLPTAMLQDRFYDPRALDLFDYSWTVVYLSFFIMPYLIAALLFWRNRQVFWRYVLATSVLFGLALVCFFAIPTSPPWLVAEAVPTADFVQIRRVTEEVLASLNLPFTLFSENDTGTMRASEVRFEPNPIAAMPSIHFAATFLLVFPARGTGAALFGAAIVYGCLMGFALVYLGEHYVLDLVAGAVLSSIGWVVGGRYVGADREG